MRELKSGNIWCFIAIDANLSSEITAAFFKRELPARFTNAIRVYMDGTNFQIHYAIQSEIMGSLKNITYRYLYDYKGYEDSDYPLIVNFCS